MQTTSWLGLPPFLHFSFEATVLADVLLLAADTSAVLKSIATGVDTLCVCMPRIKQMCFLPCSIFDLGSTAVLGHARFGL